MNVNLNTSQVRTNSFTHLTSLVGTLNSRVVTPMSRAINSTLTTYQRINQSVVGGWLINSIRENVLEYTGALGAAALGQWCLEDTMESMSADTGHLLGAMATISLGVIASKAAYSIINTNSQQPKLAKIGESAIVGVATSTLTGIILPGVGSQAGAMIGRVAGALIGAQAGAIIGGFAAVKLNGSEEVLINFQEPKNSYAIKTLQSNAANSFLALFRQVNPFIQAIQDQAVGSLAYHSLTVIKPLIELIEGGKLLDDMLPNSPLLTNEEKQLIGKGIENIYKNSSNQQAALAFAFAQGIREDVVTPFFNQDLKTLYSQLSNTQSQHALMNEQELIGITMQAFEKYFQFIFQNAAIQNAQQMLAAAFIAWKPENEALKDSNSFKQAKQNLISILENQTSQQIKNHSPQDSWDKLKEMADKVQAQELLKIIDKDKAQKFTYYFMDKLKKWEEDFFAYPLTNENLKEYVHEVVNIHLPSFCFFLALELSHPPQTLVAETVRKNYQVFNALLANYYKVGVEARCFLGISVAAKAMISSVQYLFDRQIETTQLKDVSLSHLIDLESIIKSLK